MKKHNPNILLVLLAGLVLVQFILAITGLIKGFPDVESIAKYIAQDKNGNILVNTQLGSESPFIFEMAKNSKFEHSVFRPCVIEFLNQSSEELVNKFDIKYIVLDKEKQGFTKKQNEFVDYIEKDNDFSIVKDFSRFSVIRNNNYTSVEKNKLCNYVCATKEFMCTKFKIPSDALK